MTAQPMAAAAAVDLADPGLARTIKYAVRSSPIVPEFHEDAEQEAWIGVIRAVSRYAPQKGGSFRTYAAPRARGSVIDYMRRVDHLARTHRAAVKRGEAQDITILDDTLLRSRRVEPDQERFVCRRELRDAIAKLKPRYALVIAMYYFHGETLNEIGHRLGVKESRVCQIHKAALEQLRERFKEPQ